MGNLRRRCRQTASPDRRAVLHPGSKPLAFGKLRDLRPTSLRRRGIGLHGSGSNRTRRVITAASRPTVYRVCGLDVVTALAMTKTAASAATPDDVPDMIRLLIAWASRPVTDVLLRGHLSSQSTGWGDPTVDHHHRHPERGHLPPRVSLTRLQRELCPGVGALGRHGELTADRTEIDDTAVMT